MVFVCILQIEEWIFASLVLSGAIGIVIVFFDVKRPRFRDRNSNMQGERKRVHLLKVAGRIFARLGYHGTGIRDIATASKTVPSALMYHFGDKERLFAETLRYHLFESTHVDGLFDPIKKVGAVSPQRLSDAIHVSTRNLLWMCHGPRRVPHLNGLLICLLTEAGSEVRQLFLQLEGRMEEGMPEILRQACPGLTDEDVFFWLQLFWSQIFHTITAGPLILEELQSGATYAPEMLEAMAWRIAWHCCLPLGLPAPERANGVK